jgi:hypothetical protein
MPRLRSSKTQVDRKGNGGVKNEPNMLNKSMRQFVIDETMTTTSLLEDLVLIVVDYLKFDSELEIYSGSCEYSFLVALRFNSITFDDDMLTIFIDRRQTLVNFLIWKSCIPLEKDARIQVELFSSFLIVIILNYLVDILCSTSNVDR